MGTTSRATAKIYLLLWKHWLIQKRHPLQLITELVMPLLVAWLMVTIRGLKNPVYFNADTTYKPFPVGMNLSTIPLPNMAPKWSGWPGWSVAWAPNNTAVRDVMLQFGKKSKLNVENYGFAGEEEMERFILNSFDNPVPNKDFLCGIVFANQFDEQGKFSSDIQLKIRMRGLPRINGSLLDPTTWVTDAHFPTIAFSGPRSRNRNEGGLPGYHREGFLTLQDWVSRSLTEIISGQSTDDVIIEMNRFPYPPYADDPFVNILGRWMPAFIILSYVYTAINITKNVVKEKEKRLKESMKMMGLPNWLHWSAWFFKYLVYMNFFAIALTIAFKVHWYSSRGSYTVFHYSGGAIIWLFFLLFGVATISACFLLSVFFSKANAASTATGVVWFMSYLFGNLFVRPRYATLSLQQKVMSCFIPNTALTLGIQIISRFEAVVEGAQWSNISRGVTIDDTFTLSHVMRMFIVDTVVYMLLALYTEAVFPGEYGVPLPWYFPLTKTYWCGNTTESQDIPMTGALRTEKNEQFMEEEPMDLKAGIQIRGLIKQYNKKAQNSVDNIHLNMYEDQITVLLGHNGAGKTTTMSVLTGLYPPTRGTALVNGFDVRENIESVRGSMGLCPQYDVLFDEMTVEEHLKFFCGLKGYPEPLIDSEIDRLLDELSLQDKKRSAASALSGGMRRKLSVAIALCADSKVVMFDEPTSGMDPTARRLTWDLLQREKKGRTILLTTHYMDEADLLGDRIAIMASGQIQCCGSPLFLKKKYGAGYNLTIVKNAECNADEITSMIRNYIPDVIVNSAVGAELSYVLPDHESHHFSDVFEKLERNQRELGIASFGASLTTMEEVFIRVGELVQIDKKGDDPEEMAKKNERDDADIKKKLTDAADYSKRHQGMLLFFQQFVALLRKKYILSSRHYLLCLAQLIIPICFVAIPLIIERVKPDVEDSISLKIGLERYPSSKTLIGVSNGDDDPSVQGLWNAYQTQLSHSGMEWIDAVKATRTITDSFLGLIEQTDVNYVNTQVMVGATFAGSGSESSRKVEATGWFNNQAYHTAPLSLNLIHNALLMQRTNNNSYRLTITNHPLPFDLFMRVEAANSKDGDGSIGFKISNTLVLGMAFLAGSFILSLVKERVTKAKHLQFVSGAGHVTFWMANLLWDFANFIIPCISIMIMFAAFNVPGLASADQFGRIFLLFLLFTWATLPLMYLFSFLFATPSGGFTKTVLLNLILGLVPMYVVAIIKILDMGLANAAFYINWFFMVVPSYSLGVGFNNLYTNYQALEVCTPKTIAMCPILPNLCCKSYGNCGLSPCVEFSENFYSYKGLGIGSVVVALAGEGFFFFAILALIEMNAFRRIKSFIQKFTKVGPPRQQNQQSSRSGNRDLTYEDNDVAAEKELIHTSALSKLQKQNNLILKDVIKVYDNEWTAVDGLCLAVGKGECFGLLGVNGAGKTSTFKMLTGDTDITSGDALVNGFNINTDLNNALQSLGYCPQFDAVPQEMTGSEALRLFAALRGIPEECIETIIDDLSTKLFLRGNINKMIKEMSGGNRRKVSTAVALIGDPPIVLLDEPTSGMDPVSRRQSWNTISRAKDNGQSVIITTHSMEECDALCTRIAIMVNGKFQCLGSSQHLKNKFGQGYTVIAKVRSSISSPHVNPTSMAPLMNFIVRHFPGAVLHDYHQGLVQYHLPQYAGMQWARIFSVMESAKKQFHIEDYSVGQTTLEQVFLSFAVQQNRAQDEEVSQPSKNVWDTSLKNKYKDVANRAESVV